MGEDQRAKIEAALADGGKSNKELRECFGLDVTKPDKKLDTALQRLRREGKIKVVDGRWVLEDIELCPCCEGKGFRKKPVADAADE